MLDDLKIKPVVSAYNEWDPLEEVIVGIADGACLPAWHVALKATMPPAHWAMFERDGGKPFAPELIAAANRDLAEFVHILEAEGVTVRRPVPVDHARPFAAPGWTSPSGLYAAMPRDILLVIGDEIIESPMAWRCRHHEISAYRPLLREYFTRGARWTSAPQPELSDELYDADYEERLTGPMNYVVNEREPVFDAADFVRCGRDIFCQRSHVTNELGIQWLERHLGSAYKVHRLVTDDRHPMHIDASFMPLAPGKLLINPERIKKIPAMFDGWDVIVAPPPSDRTDNYLCSAWVSMNVLMLDERRVMVERQEMGMISVLRDHGFKPILCDFRSFNKLGGSFHCATADVRRRGTLQSYF